MVKFTPRRIFRYGEFQVFLQSTKSQSRNPLRTLPLTLIVKFLGYELDRLPGKLIHQKIMGTYSVILKLGS